MQEQNMPSTGLYLFLTILGFLFGILWCILCINPYKALKVVFLVRRRQPRYTQAKKIRIFVIIGVVLNVLIVIGQLAQAGMI